VTEQYLKAGHSHLRILIIRFNDGTESLQLNENRYLTEVYPSGTEIRLGRGTVCNLLNIGGTELIS
jgi:hypothetical protein